MMDKNDWLQRELHTEREMRQKAEAELVALKVGLLQAIGNRARAALLARPQPTSSMALLSDMRFERDMLRAELKTIAYMADKGAA